jgi:hypothetical protein
MIGTTGPNRRVVLGGGGVAVVLAAAFLLAPPMGTDLAAQVARADFAGAAPVDLRWYGGTVQYGYSLLTPWLMAALGVRVTGALAAVVAAAAFAFLLVRAGARRPLLGAVLGAVTAVGNLVSGRVTFAVGLALGLLSLGVLTTSRPPRPLRLGAGALFAGLATWASPVAGLFVGLAGAALFLARRRLSAEAVVLCVAPAVAVLPVVFLGDGGRQLYTAESMRINVALALAVALAVRYRPVRVGAVLAAALLVAAYYVPSPVGFNAARLPMLYAVPVVAAFADLDRRWLAAALAAMVWWQPPVVLGDLTTAGSAESRAAFYRPLLAELGRRAPIGRVEVVPLRDHWESAYVAAAVPLARGWERQVDVARNPLFYDEVLSAEEYRDWLRRNAVSYVAVAPASRPDRYARTEAAVIGQAPPYLREVWRDARWRLYEVAEPQPLVSPGVLVASGADRVVFDAEAAGEVTVRVRWSRWLTGSGRGTCVRPGVGGWTLVRVAGPGRYVLSSALKGGPRC